MSLPSQWSAQWTWSTWGDRGLCKKRDWSVDSSCLCQHIRTNSTWDSEPHETAGRTTLWKNNQREDNSVKRHCSSGIVEWHCHTQRIGSTEPSLPGHPAVVQTFLSREDDPQSPPQILRVKTHDLWMQRKKSYTNIKNRQAVFYFTKPNK